MTTEETEVSPLVRDARQLVEDVRQGAKDIVGITDIGDLTKHLRETLWPTLEALAEINETTANEIDELDGAVIELAEGDGEMLTAETAGVFATLLLNAKEITAELEKRLTANEGPMKAKVAAFYKLIEACEAQLDELTVVADDDDDDDAEAA